MTTTTCERIGDASGPEWLAQRRKGIGGSDAAAACGLDPYRTPLHVYVAKTEQVEDAEETDAMRLGTLLEPVVLAEFAHKTGWDFEASPGLFRSTAEPFMLATPDAELTSEPEGVEAKTTTWRSNLGDEESDEIPNGWLMQCQHYIAVMGWKLCHVAVLVDGRKLRTYEVERNDRLITHLIAAERELWERIQNDDPPEPDWGHPRTADLIVDLYDAVSDLKVNLSAEAGEWWNEYEALGRVARDAEKQRKKLKARVMLEMGDAGFGVLPGGERMIKRSTVERKGYTVEPSSYVRVSAVKCS